MVAINGAYAGLGIDPVTGKADESDTVAQVIDFVRRKYTPARENVAPGRVYTRALEAEITREQADKSFQARLLPGEFFVPGVVNAAWKYASGFLKRPAKIKPVIFTVEGHMSNLWAGPSASVGAIMSAEGRAYWQPTGYDCLALPFNNADGVQQLLTMFIGDRLPDGTPFPTGTKWGISGFSQGAMVVSDFMRKHVLPANGILHWRLKDFVYGFCFGNPDRERGAQVPWNDNPPDVDTSGIMLDELFVTTGTELQGRWGETANVGDMFADCTNDEAGKDKAAIAKIVTRNSWVGGEVALFARVLSIFKDLPTGAFNAIKATVSAIMFLAKNPNPHYGTIAEPGDLDAFRQRFPVVA